MPSSEDQRWSYVIWKLRDPKYEVSFEMRCKLSELLDLLIFPICADERQAAMDVLELPNTFEQKARVSQALDAALTKRIQNLSRIVDEFCKLELTEKKTHAKS